MKEKLLALVLIIVFSVTAYVCTNVNAQITYPSPSWDYSPITPRVGDVVTFDASYFFKT